MLASAWVWTRITGGEHLFALAAALAVLLLLAGGQQAALAGGGPGGVNPYGNVTCGRSYAARCDVTAGPGP